MTVVEGHMTGTHRGVEPSSRSMNNDNNETNHCSNKGGYHDCKMTLKDKGSSQD